MSSPSHPSTRREFIRQTAGLAVGVAGLASAVEAQSATGARRVPVIDCHAHAGTGQEMIVPWNTIGDPAELLRNMEQGRIDMSVIFPMSNSNRHKLFEEGNKEIAAICRKHPGKFIGFAKHDSVAEHGLIRDLLQKEILEMGLRGLKSHSPQPTAEVMEAVAELKIPYIYHPRRVSDFVEIARAYPQVDMILAHLGAPYSRMGVRTIMEAIDAGKRYSNVYVDTSTVQETRYLEEALREAGPGKLCFGSDAPDCDSRLEVFKIRNAMAKVGTSQEEQAMVLGGNLLKLLNKSGRRPIL
jgi:predicted TIM-barrel fold metal-dependent hydrolase